MAGGWTNFHISARGGFVQPEPLRRQRAAKTRIPKRRNKLPDPASITDREHFCEFLEALYHDFQENPAGWESKSLGDFLEAFAAYARDVDGYYANHDIPVDADRASWRVFADILTGARIYE